jgi:Fic family protein
MDSLANRAGHFVQQQPGPAGYSAFIPAPLPPKHLNFEESLARAHESAAYALGRLDGASARLDPDRLLYMYVRKEAVLSSQIEGTQSTLSDLLKYENEAAPGTPLDDVREVSRYVDALLYAAEQIRTGALPLSLRLIRNAHERLMRGGRGGSQAPGEFRRTQNWIGGTRPENATYVPPPPHQVMPALDNLEKFLHDEYGPQPPIVKAGLAHAQFETIHPFLDGNGRVGRLLISLSLMADGALTNPFFYLSLYFRQNRADYCDALQRIRTKGDWEGWLHFFLLGVEAVAEQATSTAEALRNLFLEDRKKVEGLGRAAPSALKVYDVLRERVLLSATRGATKTNLSWPTVQKALDRLERLGIVEEVTGRQRDRVYGYTRQLRVLDEGLEG